jgi:hypothetical protein
MTGILADYREWADGQPARVSTHSDRCHLWHEPCMIHRLARALERASQNCDLPTLTDAERSAIFDAADRYAALTPECVERVATLRGLLERTKAVEK